MARTIPNYNRQFLATGVQGGRGAQSAVSSASPIGEGLQNLGQSLGRVANDMEQRQAADMREQKKQLEDRAAVDVANVLSTGDVYWQEDFARRTQEWAPGSPDLREGIAKDVDKWASENEQKLPTEASKQYFRQHAVKLRAKMQMDAFSFQEKATTDKLNVDTMAAEQADENTVFSDPSRYDEVLRRRGETTLARSDLSEAAKVQQLEVFKRKLAVAAERGQIEKDPLSWYRERFGEPKLPGMEGGSAAPAGSRSIALAIYGQESAGGKADTSRVNSQNVTGPMQMQENTFNGMKRLGLIPVDFDWKNPEQNKEAGFKWVDHLAAKYGGDPQKVAAAYYGGEGAVAADGTIKRHWKNKQRPNDPTVGEYVDQVVQRIDKGVPAAKVAEAGGEVLAPTAPRSFASMDWEQQAALRAQAEARIKQDDTRVVANVSAKAAEAAVQRQRIGVDLTVDISKAKDDAIAAAESKLGRPLDEIQRQQIESSVERAANVRERDRKRDQDNVAQAVLDLLDENGGDYQAVRAAMPGELDKLPREVQQRMQGYAGQVATGQTRETDWVVYAQLVENPQTLAAVNLPALRDKFSAAEYAQLTKLQEAGRKADPGMADQTIQGDMAVVKGLMREANISGKDKEAQFFSVLQREMDVRRASTGQKSLKQEEVKALAADLLTREITHKGVLWDTKTPAFQIEVPVAERAKIVAALNAAGMPVNDSTVLRAYRNKLNRNTQAQTGAATVR